jgi:hypothetical protein
MTISKSIKTLFFASSMVLSLSSCSNDDDAITANTLTEEEAVELIEASLQKSTGGLNQTTEAYS